MKPGISALMSVYANTDAIELKACLGSIEAQSLTPNEIVVVEDGPLAKSVYEVLDTLADRLGDRVKRLSFTKNRGLGEALADGLNACSYELVARVDTDDVSVPQRFALQYEAFIQSPSLTVVGGLLSEHDPLQPDTRPMVRTVPLDHAEIIRRARYRNPFNHPTVMFRRQPVLDCGNYQAMLWFEDYYLWARLILSGARMQNLDQVLVQAKADHAYFGRRGGLRYLMREVALARAFRAIGYHNWLSSLRFLVTRAGFRMVPVPLRRLFYARLLRQRHAC